MILQNGPVAELIGQSWYGLELTNEHTLEAVIRRVAVALTTTFGDKPAEIFLPVGRRDLDVFELKSGVYIFVRGDYKLIKRLCKVTGVIGFVGKEVSSGRNPEQFFEVRPSLIADAEVQPMIAASLAEFSARSEGLKVGSFCRILDGKHRDYCGTVMAHARGTAVVEVSLSTLTMFVETPVANLLPLHNVPPDRRVFFYCPAVAELPYTALLRRKPDEVLAVDGPPAPEVPAFSFRRDATATGLVRKMIAAGVTEPKAIAKATLEAIRAGTLRRPKNLFILYVIIRNSIFKHCRNGAYPDLRDYRMLVRRLGHQYKFTPEMILELDPEIGIPLDTTEPTKDGRCRAAREAKKKLLMANK